MIKIPSEEIEKIKSSLKENSIKCTKELESSKYSIHEYTCDFDTKGEQKSSLSTTYFRNKLVDNELLNSENFEYVMIESMIVLPRKTKEIVACPDMINVKDLKIKSLLPHHTTNSCYYHYEGHDTPLSDIVKFIKRIKSE